MTEGARPAELVLILRQVLRRLGVSTSEIDSQIETHHAGPGASPAEPLVAPLAPVILARPLVFV
jgi:hypothetical protein